MNNKLVGIVIVLVLGIGVLTFLFSASDVGTVGGDRPSSNGIATSNMPTFSGRVFSAAGALIVGGEESDSGHAVVGATVYLVPTSAIDIDTKMTASAIYAAPYPAESYDEPLEDSIRLKGTEFPQECPA